MFKKRITEKDIFRAVNDADLFNFYFGEVDLNRTYPSVFRVDKRPSTGFFVNNEGRLVYNDFATDEKYNSIEFVQKKYELNYGQALDKIADDFKIKDGGASMDRTKAATLPAKRSKKYEVRIGRWTVGELNYWKELFITEQELKDRFIYPLRRIKVNGFEIPNEHNYLKFLYLVKYKDEEYIKVYSPNDPDYKWMGNVPGYALFGYNELDFSTDTLLIAKSQKERLIFLKFFKEVVALQSERVSAISKEDMELFRSKYKRIIYFGDNDTTGLRVVNEFKEAGIESINYPEHFLTKFKIKDTGDFVKKWGLDNLKTWLRHNKLI